MEGGVGEEGRGGEGGKGGVKQDRGTGWGQGGALAGEGGDIGGR